MAEKYRIFIASSSEQIQVARQIAEALKEPKEWTIRVWDKLFNFSASYIESLERELDLADFAVVVLTGDDAANKRKEAVVLPRDNVIFELGLFIGRLERPRCFFFVAAGSNTEIASDLSGVKPVTFYPDGEATVPDKPSIKTQARQVKNQMRDLRARYKTSKETRSQQEALWRFSCCVAGHWWERMRRGEDDKSALGYLTLSIDPVTNTPKLEGKAYGLTGEPLADWKSVGTNVMLGEKPKVYYRWEGEHEDAHGQTYGGHGIMIFDDNDRLQTAEGYYFDTNFAQIKEGAPTRVKHCGLYRCNADDVQRMQQPFSDEALALIKDKLQTLRGR